MSQAQQEKLRRRKKQIIMSLIFDFMYKSFTKRLRRLHKYKYDKVNIDGRRQGNTVRFKGKG